MRELKVSKADAAAERMEMTEDGSKSIRETELGQNVLTLKEVAQTFEVDSAMYNIKDRTVMLKKNKVEVDGKTKLIVMVRDVTDKVSLEQEQIKKRKGKVHAVQLLKNLDEVFVKHSREVDQICGNQAVKLKQSKFHLFLNFCELTDMINIQNDTFVP